MTPDPQPPVFPRVSGPSDDTSKQAETSAGSIFSKPTPTQPVAQTDGPGAPPSATGGNRSRWLIALLATIAVVAVIGGVFLSLGPRAGSPSVAARYAPADTAMLIEAQLDLPGDQQVNLAEFMSHFPGFADPAAFDQKMAEMLEQAVSSFGGGEISWQTDVEPWFGGLVAMFSTGQQPSQVAEQEFTVAMSIKDRAALEQVLSAKVTDAQSEDYQGHQLWTSTQSDGPMVLAATDEVLLIGSDADQVKAALDAHDDRAPGIADDEFYLQQLGQLSANRLGSFYYDGVSAGMPLPNQAMEGMPDIGALQPLIAASAARVVGELRAEGDHLEIVARSERSSNADLPPLSGNATTNLAEKAPSDAVLYLEMRDVGTTLGFLLDTAMAPLASPGTDPNAMDPRLFEQLLGTPLDEYFDFIDDASLSFAGTSEAPQVGVVATVTDEVIANQRIDRLVSMARSLGPMAGDLSVTEEQHGATTIHVINIGESASDDAPQSVSIAVDGGRLYLGTNGSVAAALDRAAADSLASTDDYRTALEAGGASNSGIVFGDITALRSMAEATMSDAERAEYVADAQPFLEPLSHFMLVNQTDGSIVISNGFLYVE